MAICSRGRGNGWMSGVGPLEEPVPVAIAPCTNRPDYSNVSPNLPRSLTFDQILGRIRRNLLISRLFNDAISLSPFIVSSIWRRPTHGLESLKSWWLSRRQEINGTVCFSTVFAGIRHWTPLCNSCWSHTHAYYIADKINFNLSSPLLQQICFTFSD